MFFFTKKTFLADALPGMIDYHNHVLPSIDDGSDSISTTIEMIALYRELGFAGLYTTPHTMEDYYNNDVGTITNCFTSTVEQLDQNDASLLLGTSSEYMMDSGLEGILKNQHYIALPGNRLLFEFSYFQKPATAEQLIFEMLHQDLDPILAHPERYRYLSIPEIVDLKNRGCQLQINMLSLSGHYGMDALKKSEQLLLEGHANLIATDAHRVEHLLKIKELKIRKKILEAIERMKTASAS